ncbi:GntR family transcriptional regulator [Anaerocolumna sedimenticola]|nr:GntR family transcriptional regulator [Anaerocolumna sedimenticola]
MDMDKEYFRSTFHLSPNTTAPIYTQLAEYLKYQIQSGLLKPGDKMLGENDIVEILDISRTTVRLALNRLVEAGLIVRYRGRGSFIAEPKLRRSINYLYNFTENIRLSGAIPSSEINRCEVVSADEEMKEKLKLATVGQKVFVLERLRLADGEPLIIENTFIPYYLCTGIEKTNFSKASLYNVLKTQYGINVSHAEETIEAIIINKKNASILKCKNRMAGYSIERTSYLDSGYICEYTSSVTRGDRCVFKLDLYNSNNTRSGSIDFERKLSIS